jgi:CspA family cold shock protein
MPLGVHIWAKCLLGTLRRYAYLGISSRLGSGVFPSLTAHFTERENVPRATDVAARRGETMATGTVKWFNDAKGFGFIEPEAGGEDIFAHFSAIQMDGFRTLKQGGRVRFEVVQGPKGQLAQNIAAIDAPDGSAQQLGASDQEPLASPK